MDGDIIYTWIRHRIKTSIQFILQDAIYNTSTIQNNHRQDTQYKFTAQTRRHLHYVRYTERSGPFIVSSRMPPAVNAAKWATGKDKQRLITCFMKHVRRSWSQRGCEIILRTVICSTICNVRSQVPGTATVLEAQDRAEQQDICTNC
jgi:hypothetical protein